MNLCQKSSQTKLPSSAEASGMRGTSKRSRIYYYTKGRARGREVSSSRRWSRSSRPSRPATTEIDESGLDCGQRCLGGYESRNAASSMPHEFSPHFHTCKALISDYRAAGSWRSYVRAPPKELLRLRSLVARGRARERRRLRASTPREIASLFAPSFPNELFWKVTEYWNPRYEALVNARNNN